MRFAARYLNRAPRLFLAGAAGATLGAGVYCLDAERRAQLRESAQLFRSSLLPTLRLDTAPPVVIAESKAVRVDPSTLTPHPIVLYPASSPELTLVGLGVRTVSFLKMKVYSAGFYVDDISLRKVADTPDAPVDVIVDRLLTSPAGLAVRIVPVRNTDFGHLRDGFTRTLLARQKEARKAGLLTPEQDEAVSEAITEFKRCFPAGSVPKGKELLLVRSPDGRIAVEYEGRVLGGTKEPWVGRNMIASYFSKNPISEKLLEDVTKGLECHGNVKNVVLDHEKKRAGQ